MKGQRKPLYYGVGGAGGVKHSNHLEPTIVEYVEGRSYAHSFQTVLNTSNQMHPKNGPSLPMDCKLCLSSDHWTFPSFPYLCCYIYVLSRNIHDRTGCYYMEQSKAS